jgi:hypothetical protein
MYLFIDCGEAFVRSVAQSYGHRNVEGLIVKLRYFALVDQIGTILHGTGLALDGQQQAAWMRLREFLQT